MRIDPRRRVRVPLADDPRPLDEDGEVPPWGRFAAGRGGPSVAGVNALAYNYEHFELATFMELGPLGGPRVGDEAPPFMATTLAGETVMLADFRGRTVVLETGSATCPTYVKSIGAMSGLAGRFADAVFLVLYTREVHPGEHLGAHRDIADKLRAARLVAEEDRERRTILIDDLQGSAHRAYGAMPNTVHVIDGSGVVVFRAAWSDPELVEEVLRRLARGDALDGLRAAEARPSREFRERVLNRAGQQAVRDFAAARPGLRYLNTPAWDIGRPQPALLALARAGAVRGRVLDAACGTGEHALMAAGLGLDATGVDLAPNAVERAREKARSRGLLARFLVHDALRLPELGESFDTVLECGLFHSLDGENRAAYAESLRSVVVPGGRYFMLGFSDRVPDESVRRLARARAESTFAGFNDQLPGDRGPRAGLTREDIQAAFAGGWRVDSIEPATIDSNIHPDGVPAWLAAATRLPESGSC